MLDSQDTQFHSPRNLYKCHNLSSIGSCIALSWFSHGCDSPGLNRNKINKPTVSISKGKVEVSAFSIGMPRVTLRTCSFMHKLQIMAVSFHCFGFIFTFLILRWLYKFTLSLSLHLSINIFSVFSPLHHYCYPVSVFVLKTCNAAF